MCLSGHTHNVYNSQLTPDKDRKIVELMLDRLRPREIAQTIGSTAGSVQKQTVKHVIAQWKKAAKDNPTDPVSEMVNNER